MWIICDKDDVIQDISTEEANLSRGYAFDGHKKHKIEDVLDVAIRDRYDGEKLIENEVVRAERKEEAETRVKINIEKDKILEEQAVANLEARGEI